MEKNKISTVNIKKRNKFKMFLTRAVGVLVLVYSVPSAFSGYIFKENNSTPMFDIGTTDIKAYNDIIGKAFIGTSNKVITYDGNGDIDTVTNGTRVWTYTWGGDGNLDNITDGVITKTYTWNVNDDLTNVTVTGGI